MDPYVASHSRLQLLAFPTQRGNLLRLSIRAPLKQTLLMVSAATIPSANHDLRTLPGAIFPTPSTPSTAALSTLV
jgi:hypothetical protein